MLVEQLNCSDNITQIFLFFLQIRYNKNLGPIKDVTEAERGADEVKG